MALRTPPPATPPLTFTGYVRADNSIVALAEVPPASIDSLPAHFERYVTLVLHGHHERNRRAARVQR